VVIESEPHDLTMALLASVGFKARGVADYSALDANSDICRAEVPGFRSSVFCRYCTLL